MPNASRLLIALILASTPFHATTRLASAAAEDDRQVLAAIIEHTTRPEVRRFSKLANIQGQPLLLILDQTSTVCESGHDRSRQVCVTAEELATMIGRGRASLVEAFIERNRQSEPVPLPDNAGVLRIPFWEVQQALKQRSRETVGYSAFSLPGYSDDGQALVFGFYTCGGLCSSAQLFVLSRTDAGWQVKTVLGLWRS